MNGASWTEPALRALRFAAEAHAGQIVPGTTHPYLVHVCSVAFEILAALQAEPRERAELAVQCALLHDVVEDTPVGLARVEAEFGANVAAGVDALSKRAELPKEQRMADSLRRIREQPHEVWMVKLADRITNLQPPPRLWTPEKCRAYREEGEHIADVLGAASPLLERRLRERARAYRAYEG